MSLRSLLVVSAAALSLAAFTNSASACAFGPEAGPAIAAPMQVAQATPQPAGATITAQSVQSSQGDVHSAPTAQPDPTPAPQAATTAPAPQAADPQN